jgi:hypothetical protein
MLTTGTISIGASATLIFTAAGATKLTIHAATTAVTTLGDNTVAAGNGYPVALSSSGIVEAIDLTLSDGDAVYGVGAGASAVNFIATN